MKNIHILPTDNYSLLVYSTSKYGGLFLSKYYSPMKVMGDSYQHIYITSNEEIKVGDWVIEFQKNDNIGQVHFINSEYVIARDIQKKIILTTDFTLSPDVHKIPDEFLEWFVKNPSCEEVEVNSIETNPDYKSNWENRFTYKIIIPKEEPKQDWQPIQGEQVWIKVFSNWSKGIYIGYDIMKGVHIVREPEEGGGNLLSSNEILPYKAMPNESKKETLEELFKIEEAAENYSLELLEAKTIQPHEKTWIKSMFIRIARWQKERMYSEEDLKRAYFAGVESTGEGWNGEYAGGNDPIIEEVFKEGFENWFKQFKKKMRPKEKQQEKIMKQETLEEVAEIGEFAEKKYLERLNNFQKVDFKDGVFEGAKWQRERMYSEEEVLEIIRQYALEEHLITSSKPDIWFEQFKKK